MVNMNNTPKLTTEQALYATAADQKGWGAWGDLVTYHGATYGVITFDANTATGVARSYNTGHYTYFTVDACTDTDMVNGELQGTAAKVTIFAVETVVVEGTIQAAKGKAIRKARITAAPGVGFGEIYNTHPKG